MSLIGELNNNHIVPVKGFLLNVEGDMSANDMFNLYEE